MSGEHVSEKLFCFILTYSNSYNNNDNLHPVYSVSFCYILTDVGAKGENGATPLHLAARFQIDRRADASEGPSTVATPEETPQCVRKQMEGRTSGEKISNAGNASQKSYLKPPSFGLRKRESGGTVIFK